MTANQIARTTIDLKLNATDYDHFCTLYSLNSYTKLAVFDCVNNTCIHRAVVSSRCTFCASNLGKKIRSTIRNISQLIRSVIQVKLHKCIRALTFYEKSHWILRHRPKWSVLIRQNLLDGLSRLIVTYGNSNRSTYGSIHGCWMDKEVKWRC